MKKMFYLVGIFLIVSCNSLVYACSCAGWPEVEVMFQKSEAVFIGEVVSIEGRPEGCEKIWHCEGPGLFGLTKVTFNVLNNYKGAPDNKIVLVRTGSTCNYYFSEVGEKYLVYAEEDPLGYLYASICQRTSVLSGATEDIEKLERITSDNKSFDKE